ncbi:hypothetical protein TDMWS_19490 [Thermodesulfomicrobium sp. WS]|uniref:ATP-binding protein n=1 Tax=Thermodesulfomicrobium sp. WS TaxID=3004129 RepID=UPI0024934789|nr:transporter substrate-binding domain-containing protein [Thermodesulfomicrobium sp. WS]BDV01864.1 hypothetical protein TDMWS_19490 [Thermodesulfomicrobium sp. WS]
MRSITLLVLLCLLAPALCWAQKLSFSAEEKAYLLQHPTLTVVFDRNYPPFEYLENGELQGFTRGLMELVEQRIGVHLRFVAPNTWTEALERMRQGEADIVTSIAFTPERAQFLLFTKPYLSLPLGIIVRKESPWSDMESLRGRTIALVRNYAGSVKVRRSLPDDYARFIEVGTVAEALMKVAFGEADAAIHNTAVATDVIHRLGMTTLRMAQFLDHRVDLGLATRRDAPLLASILDKTLASISPEEWQALRQRWLPAELPMDPAVRRALILAATAGTGILLVLTATALFLTRRLRARMRELEAAHAQGQAALRRLEIALEATGAGVWEHDLTTGTEQHSASSWYRMLGYPPPEKESNGYAQWQHLVHPEDLPHAEAAFFRFLQDPSVQRYTARFRMRANDGSWRWISSFAQALTRDAAGTPTHVVGVHLDIHDQEETRQQLMRSKRRLQAVLEHVPMAFALFRRTQDQVFLIEESNPATTESIGVDSHTVLGKTLFEAFPRLASTQLAPLLHKVLDQHAPHIEEDFRYVNRLNQEHFYTVIAFPVDTDLAGIFFRDITAQRLAQQEREDALRLFTTVFHLSPEALALIDRHKTILHANATFTQLTAGATVPPKILDEVRILPGELRAALCTAVFDHGETVRQDAQGIRADASSMSLSITACPLVLHDETHMLLALRDMTEHHRIQELLMQTEKMLSLGGIAAGIAHEINNPLGIILQSAQNAELRLRPDFPKNRHVAEELGVVLDDVHRYITARGIPGFLADIRDAGGRAASIIRTMLDFGRRSESRRSICAVHDMLETAIALASKDYDLKKHYDFRHITIERDYAPALPPVFVTQTEIEQIMLNLLRNAAHALHEAPPAEGPRIHITTSYHEGTIRIRIADNGPGIPPEILPRIFEPFFTTKPPGHGTGLGLAVSYFIAQNHGGRLWAESTPGQGAEFFLELPAALELTPA